MHHFPEVTEKAAFRVCIAQVSSTAGAKTKYLMQLDPVIVQGGQTVVKAFTDEAGLSNALGELGLPGLQRQRILSAVQGGNTKRFTAYVSEEVAQSFGWMSR
jgi:hypothetical protein